MSADVRVLLADVFDAVADEGKFGAQLRERMEDPVENLVASIDDAQAAVGSPR